MSLTYLQLVTDQRSGRMHLEDEDDNEIAGVLAIEHATSDTVNLIRVCFDPSVIGHQIVEN